MRKKDGPGSGGGKLAERGKAVKKATVYDIARLANVSASTVSRVASNKGTVKPSTRERIIKIMAECNYVPNETARSLVTQSSRMIGILLTDMRTTHHTNGVYYLQHAFGENGYSCLIYNTGRDKVGWVRYIQSLSQWEVEAAVFMGSVYQSSTVADALETYLPNTPVVLCNGELDRPNVYNIICDERGGVEDCVRMLKSQGRRHPAFLVNQFTPSNCLKLAGYESGMTDCFGDIAPIVVETGNENPEIYETICNFVRQHPEVDSIVFSEDSLALVGLRALADLQKKVPQDVAVIGINNSSIAEVSIPTLTSLDNLLRDMSLKAVQNILDLLNGREVPKRVVIGTKIVPRQST